MRRIFPLLLVCVLGLVACDSAARTVETTRKNLAAFQTSPNDATQTAAEQSLKKLDAQIDELDKQGGDTDLLRKQAFGLHSDFQAAKMARVITDTKNAIQGIGEALKDAGKSFSETLGNAAKKTNKE